MQCKEDLSETKTQLRDSDETEMEDVARHNAEYDQLLGIRPKLDANSKQYKNNPMSKDFVPRLMGTIRIENESDLNAMDMLTEPTELVIFLPCDKIEVSKESAAGDSSTNSTTITINSSSSSDSGVINLL